MVNFAIVLPNKAVLISLAELTAHREVLKVHLTTPRLKGQGGTAVMMLPNSNQRWNETIGNAGGSTSMSLCKTVVNLNDFIG